MLTRRSFLQKSLLAPAVMQAANIKKSNLKIGACDWSIGKGSDIGAFALAKNIGVEGIMVDVGGPANNLHLRQKDVQSAYLSESKKTDVALSSLALGVFNQVPFHSDARTSEWVSDAIDATANLKVKVLLLAFFNASDLRNDDKRKDAAVRIIKNVISRAEKKGVILGIESYLNAREHVDVIDRVQSDNLKVYFDFRNTADAGFDPVREFRELGKDMVCELHMKENGSLLDKGTINWKSVRDAVNDMGYVGDGWMQIEGALPEKSDVVDGYRHNLKYLKKLFSE